MNNIRIIETGIDVRKINAQLEQYKDDWGAQKTLQGVALQDPAKYETTVDVLQLVMGGIERIGQYVGDTEICHQTPALKHHTEMVAFLKSRFHAVRRCAFFSLPVGMKVGRHIDHGTYYLNKDRYHLSLQGRYKYSVEDPNGTIEEAIIEPGTLMWFNNKYHHWSENVADVARVSFIFDVPHHPTNP